jgi:hypothetical protein
LLRWLDDEGRSPSGNRCANAGGQGVERVITVSAQHHCLDLDAVLVVIAQG